MNDIKKEKRWVVWQLEEVNGRQTKVPYSVRGTRASSTDPSTWSTYAEAKKANEFFGAGVGVIFTPDETLLGIDIDHVIENKKIVGKHRNEIETLIKAADTHCEVSPSGTGFHLYLHVPEGFSVSGGNRRAPFEIYTKGRYFTFTEHGLSRKLKPIRTVTRAEAETILSHIGYPWKAPNETPQAGTLLDKPFFMDEEVPERMFKSKNGAKIKELWDGDTKDYSGDTSRADAALLNHLAFWTRKDAGQMERLWLESKLGGREKTRKREDYRKRSIDAAIASCKQTYEPQSATEDGGAGIDFLTSKGAKGEEVIITNTENVCRVLNGHPEFAGNLRMDVFSNIFEIKDGGVWRPFEDVDAIQIQTRISILFPCFRKIGKDMVYDAILKVLRENSYDSAIDFVTSIVWDKKNRLSSWLTKTYGVPEDIYHKAVGENWMKGLIKRIVEPGCKFDYVLVLEGEQGVKKSTSLHVLGSLPNGRSMHVETTMSTDNKDFFMQFSGKAIVEFSEGETLSRTEVKKMKAIITMQSDKYRPPYSRVSQDFPRRCVFAMTTNQEEYLKDETGNRRWLPVKVLLDQADIEWLKENRDQLFAEAYHRVAVLKEPVYEFPDAETREQQEARRISDPNEERIVDWYLNDKFINRTQMQEDGLTTQMVYVGAGLGIGSMKKHEEMAIADVLARVLKLTKRRKMVNGVQSMRWFNDNTLDLEKLMQPAKERSEFDGDLPDFTQ